MDLYYSLPRSLEGKFTLSCVLDTMRLFHSYGFHTNALVCDGASMNVLFIKGMLGCRDAFATSVVDDTNTNSHDILHCIDHPLRLHHKLYFVICPSYMLKNMINALFSSSAKGTNCHKVIHRQDGYSFRLANHYRYARQRVQATRGW